MTDTALETEVVNEVQERCYSISASKGFHATDTFRDAVDDAVGRASMLTPSQRAIVDRIVMNLEDDWEQMQHAKRLLLIVGEVVEAFEELRAGHKPAEVYEKDGKPEGVPVELADVQIRLWDLAETMGISLQREVHRKEHFNRQREYMHGKQF